MDEICNARDKSRWREAWDPRGCARRSTDGAGVACKGASGGGGGGGLQGLVCSEDSTGGVLKLRHGRWESGSGEAAQRQDAAFHGGQGGSGGGAAAH